MPANSTFSSSITHLLSVLFVLIETLSHTNAKKKKNEGFQTSHFYWSFSSDIVAVSERFNSDVQLCKLYAAPNAGTKWKVFFFVFFYSEVE